VPTLIRRPAVALRAAIVTSDVNGISRLVDSADDECEIVVIRVS